MAVEWVKHVPRLVGRCRAWSIPTNLGSLIQSMEVPLPDLARVRHTRVGDSMSRRGVLSMLNTTCRDEDLRR
jgi:hypothetical protein